MTVMWKSLLAAALAFPAHAAEPLPAHGTFVSPSYALTFVAPPDLTYCPLPDNWVGSDHGTILFLLPPRTCDGVGYASMARGFEPPTVPRIEVEYERWDDAFRWPPCQRVGHIRFLGRPHPLCRSRWRGMVVREVRGLYVADDQTEAIFTLVTFPSRLSRDLTVLRALAASARPCAIPWKDAHGRTHVEGSGRPCKEKADTYGDFH